MPSGYRNGTSAADSPLGGCQQLFPGSEYTDDEREYLQAVDAYRRRTGRKFLLATDYLRIAVKLGYRRCGRD